jgi:hypothetical protein
MFVELFIYLFILHIFISTNRIFLKIQHFFLRKIFLFEFFRGGIFNHWGLKRGTIQEGQRGDFQPLGVTYAERGHESHFLDEPLAPMA